MTATGPVSVDLGPGTATGAAGNDTLLGVVGVIGSEFDDTLRGNARSNLLAGMGGNDTIEGLSQDDWVSGDAGDDKLDGGPGSDWAWYGEARSAVRINLAQGMATGQGADQLKLLENVYGSRYADAITGNGARNTVYAQSGNDRVAGGSGPDQLDGEKGRDRVDGGAGRDRCMHAERRTRCA